MLEKLRRGSEAIVRTFLPVLAVVHAFCFSPGGQDRFIRIFFPNGRQVTAELAVSEEERAKGLMFREKVLPDQGMLFVFEKPGVHSFWMKNTLVELDMIWLDDEKRIIHIEADVPPCRAEPCPSYGPSSPARYVLELKGGIAAELGLKVTDRLMFVLPEWVVRGVRRTPPKRD